MIYISSYNTTNICHIFTNDIINYYNPNYTEVYIYSDNIDKNNICQKWRYFVMKKLYGNIQYTNKLSKNERTYKGIDGLKFIKYEPCQHIINIYNSISSKKIGKYILLNQRSYNDRHLYEYNTKLELYEYLSNSNLDISIKCCNFENMTPEQQYQLCSESAIFISVHGAGCTNLIFTPSKTPLIEINFRKHWYCDRVCDRHYNKEISVNDKCNGKLNHRPYFHKADYHNLCHLINKKYIEMEAVEYGGGFNGRNPIMKQKIYIDGKILINHIKNILQ